QTDDPSFPAPHLSLVVVVNIGLAENLLHLTSRHAVPNLGTTALHPTRRLEKGIEANAKKKTRENPPCNASPWPEGRARTVGPRRSRPLTRASLGRLLQFGLRVLPEEGFLGPGDGLLGLLPRLVLALLNPLRQALHHGEVLGHHLLDVGGHLG